jgi:hypothetical protein
MTLVSIQITSITDAAIVSLTRQLVAGIAEDLEQNVV